MSRPTGKQEAPRRKRHERRLDAHNVRTIGRLSPADADLRHLPAPSPIDTHGMAFTYSNSVLGSPESADEFADRAVEALRSELQRR